MITCTFENGKKNLTRHVTVNMLILNSEKTKTLLCRRSKAMTSSGLLCMPGGFLNRDETAAEGAAREALEETGYTTINLQLFRINDNPNRRKEDRQNVDFVYIAVAKDKVGKPDFETAETIWFDLNNLPREEEFAFDHHDNFVLYKQYLQSHFPLPYMQIFP